MKMQLSAIIGYSCGFPRDRRHRLPIKYGDCTQWAWAGLMEPRATRGAEPPPLHLSTGPYRIRHPEGSGHLAGSGHPTDWTRLKHSPHLQLTREQVLGDTGSAPGEGMERGRSSSGLGVGSESARMGQTESGGNPPAWDFICILEKGVEEPQGHTLCLPSLE